MRDSTSPLDIKRLILAPALISLGITLLRLVGELNRWSDAFFNRAPGGPGALVGIVWLVPIFGIYFALVLRKAGLAPDRRGPVFGFVLGGIVLFIALYSTVPRVSSSMVVRIVLINVVAALSAYVASRGWPALSSTLFAYGLAARIPVAIVMLVAMAANWGTHYELGPPGLPEMSLLPKWVTIGLLPQLLFWIAFTVMVGSLFGALALFVPRAARPAVPQRA